MDNIISQRLKEAIAKRGLKQVDIVNKTGINKGALSSYINGKYHPKASNIEKLSQVLNVNKMWLLGYDVPMEDSALTKIRIKASQNTKNFKKGQIIKGEEVIDYARDLEKIKVELLSKLALLKKINDEIQMCTEEKQKLTERKNNNKISKQEYQELSKMLDKIFKNNLDQFQELCNFINNK